MTGPEHYRKAELLVRLVEQHPESSDAVALATAAQVHATLALAAPAETESADALTEVLRVSLADFQSTAHLSSLQHAQTRAYLAEHLANSLINAGYRNGAR